MVHPYFASAKGTGGGKMFSAKYIVSVHRPDRIVYQSKIFLGNLFGFGTVGVHLPNIIASTGIAGKADVFAIRTIPGLHLIGMSAPNQGSSAPVDGHGIDIAQHIKNDLTAVRTYIQTYPGPFVGGNGDLFKGQCRSIDIPFVFFGFFFFL
jgi:hypothetical protein